MLRNGCLKYIYLILVLLIALISGCGDGSAKSRGDDRGNSDISDSSRPAGRLTRFKSFSYIDKNGTGIEAFRLLIPADWRFEGGISWVLDNPGLPATAHFRVSDPGGSREFEVFPNLPFFWSDNRMLLDMFPIGSRYFGNEVRPPLGPLAALNEIVIPLFRRNVSGLKIISQENLPDLAESLGAGQSQPGVSTSASGAKVRIEYIRAGKPMEEEIYAIVESASFPIQTMYGPATNMNWYVDYIFSFKAPKGELDGQAKTFQTIARSFRLSPKWFSKYSQLVEYLIQSQIQQIRNVGELSRIISRTSDEISDISMRAYNNRQKVNDRIADNFSRYIRGVDEYYNPIEEKNVELPSGYENAWTNSLGEYILSEESGYNPNIGSNLNWRRIERRE
jgi:hypothetical protein